MISAETPDIVSTQLPAVDEIERLALPGSSAFARGRSARVSRFRYGQPVRASGLYPGHLPSVSVEMRFLCGSPIPWRPPAANQTGRLSDQQCAPAMMRQMNRGRLYMRTILHRCRGFDGDFAARFLANGAACFEHLVRDSACVEYRDVAGFSTTMASNSGRGQASQWLGEAKNSTCPLSSVYD